MSANPYLGFLITACVMFPGYFYVIYTLEHPRFGRKKSLCGALILTGVMLTTHPFIPKEFSVTRVVMSTFGRYLSSLEYIKN